jgi:hypothetical protein
MQQFTKKRLWIPLSAAGAGAAEQNNGKEIVEDCGINGIRFTITLRISMLWLTRLYRSDKSKKGTQLDNRYLAGKLMNLMQFINENKKFIHNLYTSINRERLSKYIQELSEIFVEGLVRFCAEDTNASEEDIQAVIRLEKYLIMGCIMEWLANGMKDQLGSAFFELGSLFSESITLLLKSSQVYRNQAHYDNKSSIYVVQFV